MRLSSKRRKMYKYFLSVCPARGKTKRKQERLLQSFLGYTQTQKSMDQRKIFLDPCKSSFTHVKVLLPNKK